MGTGRSAAVRRRAAWNGDARRAQSVSLLRCLVMRNAARRRSSQGSAIDQRKFAREPLCSTSGLSFARLIGTDLRYHHRPNRVISMKLLFVSGLLVRLLFAWPATPGPSPE